MIKYIKRDPELWKMLICIGMPIAVQNLLTSLTQMMDTIMLGELGDIPLTASSLANQFFFIFSLFIFGMCGGGSILTAQYWGKKELEPIKTIMAMVLRGVMMVAVVAMVGIYLFPAQVMGIYTSDVVVIEEGVKYLRIVAPIYVFFGMSCTLTTLFRSIEIVKLAVIANLMTLCVNVTLNYILIFGKLGMPALGLEGAAYATLIARFMELVVVIIYVFCIEKELKFTWKCFLKKDKLLLSDLRRYCIPVVTNELVWSVGISMQTALFGHLSTLAVSANTIISVVQNLATLVIFGVAHAACVIVGKTIGEGNVSLARQRAKSIEIFAVMLGVIAALLILLGRDFMVDFYNVEEATKVLAKEMLLVAAVIVLFISYGGTSIIGTLRGGGDAKFCLIVEVIALWGVSVPLGYIAGLWLQLPIVVVFALFKFDEIVKVFCCFWRQRSDKWMNEVTR